MSTLALFLWWFGLILVFSPAMLFVLETRDGDINEGDLIRWFMGKSLQFHDQCKTLIVSGVGLMALATILGTVR